MHLLRWSNNCCWVVVWLYCVVEGQSGFVCEVEEIDDGELVHWWW